MKPANIVERIKTRPPVFDGAMGTRSARGEVILNACYDELCMPQSKLVAGMSALAEQNRQ